MRLLRTHEDSAAYERWLNTRSTEWLEAFKARLAQHPDTYNGRAGQAVRDRLDLVKTTLWRRADVSRRTSC
jgi:hypothetical protein